jgi:ATP-dependent Lon protease
VPLLPTRDLVLFPGASAPLIVGRSISAAAVDEALRRPEPLVLVVLQRRSDVETPASGDVHEVGTLALIRRTVRLADGRLKAVVEGLQRVRLGAWMPVATEPAPQDPDASPALSSDLATGLATGLATDLEPGLLTERAMGQRADRALVLVTPEPLPGPGTSLGSGVLGDPRGPLHDAEVLALLRQLREDLQRFARTDKLRSASLTELLLDDPHEPGPEGNEAERFADRVASQLSLPPAEAQRVLEGPSVAARLRQLAAFLRRELQLLELQEDIRTRTRDVLSRAQREHFLREQLRQIHSELEDGRGDEVEELRRQLSRSGAGGEALAEAERQIRRLEQTPPHSAEGQVIRAHLDWLLELPWQVLTQDRFDLAEARRILDEEHHGLLAVKQRVLEFLSVLRLRQKGPASGVRGGARLGTVLCLSGPPGVGKTSLGRSIARALGRRFVRVALGGVRDDAELRGHRRTYVGAMPGRLMQGLRQAGARNPVLLLDEIDKLCEGAHGDPAAALLEILDPEQNHAFRDHYLGVPFDLSEVLFIATANSPDRIPPALRDRLELVTLPGYTDDEKLAIAAQHIVPRALLSTGLLPAYPVRFTRPALRALVRDYTREAGVRELERQIGAVCRKLAHQIAEQEAALSPQLSLEKLTASRPGPAPAGGQLLLAGVGPAVPPSLLRLTVGEPRLRQLLGPSPVPPRLFNAADAGDEQRVGVALGLAWTPVGGEVLEIETQRMPGTGGLRLTGQLGEVMRESAQAALSFVRGWGAARGLPDPMASGDELHVHVPAGAIPKDGPSAGVTIACALASLISGVAVRGDVAMTGELTLRGRVLPVGGLKEKLLAAERAGVKTVLVPAGSAQQLAALRRPRSLQVVLVSDMDGLLREALVCAPAAQHTRTHATPRPGPPGEKRTRHGASRRKRSV